MPRDDFDPWSPVDVDAWIEQAREGPLSASTEEPLGSKDKFWLSDPGGDTWLFKFARTSGKDRWVSGEDWAEVAAVQLARLINIPTAAVRLGTSDGRRGLLSRNLVPSGGKLEHGNELLSAIDLQYEGGRSNENNRYTVVAVERSLRSVEPPLGWSERSSLTSFDVWAGYLLFDAWLAGTDRHDENWGVILGRDGTRRLAPSFDHGNALGFQLRPDDHRRLAALDRDMELWASRGRCRYFAGRPQLTTLARPGPRGTRSLDFCRKALLALPIGRHHAFGGRIGAGRGAESATVGQHP